MALRKHVTLFLFFGICLFLDTAVLPRWNLFKMVPFVMLALTLAADQVFSLQTAMVIGAFGGLFEDLLCENLIGLTPALCLLSAVVYEKLPKNSDTKPPILGLYCALLALAAEVLRALAAWVIGMRFGFLSAVLYGALPRALLTGLWALIFMAIFKPLLKRQVDAA
ncbi:MAG: hypothetical protein IJH54_03565 [Clostridia bacterium]|nr:hypothetical protein [Clostridia bacterium]